MYASPASARATMVAFETPKMPPKKVGIFSESTTSAIFGLPLFGSPESRQGDTLICKATPVDGAVGAVQLFEVETLFCVSVILEVEPTIPSSTKAFSAAVDMVPQTALLQ